MRGCAFILLMVILNTVSLCQTVFTRIVPSETAALRDPSAISVAPDGSLVISDTGHHRVLSVDKEGKLLFEVGSMGSGLGEFLWPKDIAAESGIAFWVADYGNRRICKLSRQFEFKGSFVVADNANDTAEQIEKIAVSPQGDVYLYAEDSGQLLRFDPLFVKQGSLGSTLGEDFIPRIRQLVFVSGKGVVWHSRGDKYFTVSDPLLTRTETLPVRLERPDEYVVAASGSELFAASVNGVFRLSMEGDPVQEVVNAEEIKAAGMRSIDDMAVASDGMIYLLESRSGSVYSATLRQQ